MISDTEVPPLEDVPVILEKLKLEEQKKAMQSNKSQQDENKKNSSHNFGGMKKGFLFGNTSSASSKKGQVKAASASKASNSNKNMETDGPPTIKAQSGNSSLVLKEVQEAMIDDHPMNNFQQQLSSKIGNNSQVSEVLSDPEWMPILEEFQKDPTAAMIKYKDNYKVRGTMQELCSVLGDSFLNMSKVNLSDDEILLEKLMATQPDNQPDNQPVKDSLTDQLIEQITTYVNQGATDKVRRCLEEATPAQRSRIQVLVDHSLLSFSM